MVDLRKISILEYIQYRWALMKRNIIIGYSLAVHNFTQKNDERENICFMVTLLHILLFLFNFYLLKK